MWQQALRAFTSSRGAAAATAAATLPERRRLFDTVAQAHLFGPVGFQLHPQAMAAVREARWAVMRGGSVESRAGLLEHVLRAYAKAERGYEGSGAAAEADAVRHEMPFLAEMIEAVAEAKAAGVPVGPRHLQHLLLSPKLAAAGPDLPLVLMEELRAPPGGAADSARPSCAAQESHTSAGSPPMPASKGEAAALAACCAGLATAGHPELAVALCPAALFPRVVELVVGRHRDGWQRALPLLDQIPPEKYFLFLQEEESRGGGAATGEAAEAAEDHYQQGAAVALAAQFRATESSRRRRGGNRHQLPTNSEQSKTPKAWIDSVFKRAARHPLLKRCPPPHARRLLEAYVRFCPSAEWRDARALVEAHNRHALSGAAAPAAPWDQPLPPSKLMHLALLNGEPESILEMFYGKDQWREVASAAESLTGGPAAGQDAKDASTAASLLFTAHLGEDNPFVTADNCMTPATLNFVMLAFASTGHFEVAMTLYHLLPPQSINNHTHLCALRMFACPIANAPSALPPYNDRTFLFCVSALRSLLAPFSTGDNLADTFLTNPSPPQPLPVTGALGSLCRDGVLESMWVWAAARLQTDASPHGDSGSPPPSARGVLRDTLLPHVLDPSLRYAPLMALASALRGDLQPASTRLAALSPEALALRLFHHICASPRASVKQILFALALFIHHPPAFPICVRDGGPSGEWVLAGEVLDSALAPLAAAIAGSQSNLDTSLQILAGYFHSVRANATRVPLCESDLIFSEGAAAGSENASGRDAAPSMRLAPQHLLTNTFDLTRGAPCRPDGWKALLQVVQALGVRASAHSRANGTPLSTARAAPALISLGVPADIAIHFLPS